MKLSMLMIFGLLEKCEYVLISAIVTTLGQSAFQLVDLSVMAKLLLLRFS